MNERLGALPSQIGVTGDVDIANVYDANAVSASADANVRVIRWFSSVHPTL